MTVHLQGDCTRRVILGSIRGVHAEVANSHTDRWISYSLAKHAPMRVYLYYHADTGVEPVLWRGESCGHSEGRQSLMQGLQP